MTLLEEKKMVLKWLGKAIDLRWYWPKGYNKAASKKRIEFWNPKSDRNCWDEIWSKLRETALYAKYNGIVWRMCQTHGELDLWKLHTAKPEICWQALIKALEES